MFTLSGWSGSKVALRAVVLKGGYMLRMNLRIGGRCARHLRRG